jgi:hypothetical protein
MKTYRIYLEVGLVCLIGLIGCAASAPWSAMNDLITVEVMPAGPPIWTYTIWTSGAENLVAVEFVSSADLSQCTVTALPDEVEIATTQTPQGLKVSLRGTRFGQRFEQFRKITLVLNGKRKKNGAISLRVTDFAGNVRRVGPVAGPA